MDNLNIKHLKVSMFNTFEISCENEKLTYDAIRSDKVIKLLVYLITHRTQIISTQEITDVIWQNEEIDNPVGALKNLVYRLRTLLKKTFDLPDCIITGRGSYSWNPSIVVETDVDLFDEVINELKNKHTEEEQLELYRKAVSAYKGSFMPKLADEHWIIPIVTYYHSSYLSMIKRFGQLLDQLGYYNEMEEFCKKAIEIDALDEELHYLFIKSLIGQGKQKLAAEHYKATTKMLYETLGTRPSDKLQQLYRELQKIRNSQEMDLLEIQKDLEEQVAQGAFICEYGTFKDIYRLQARMAGRLGISVYVSLITILPNSNLEPNTDLYLKTIAKSMRNMEDILTESLRVGDIIARYSSSQFVVLLPTCTFEDATNVMQRLLNKFYVGIKNNKTKVQYNLQNLVLTDVKYQK